MMRKAYSQKKWCRSPHVAFTDEEARVVVLDLSDPASARPMALIGPAARLWHALGVEDGDPVVRGGQPDPVEGIESAADALLQHRLIFPHEELDNQPTATEVV
jgi:hypothetical protein